VAVGHPSEVPNLLKAVGQPVQQKAVDELVGAESDLSRRWNDGSLSN
jgi:hypothetical protein